MKHFLLFIFLSIAISCSGKTDCRCYDYRSSINTSTRPVYLLYCVDSIPNALKDVNLTRLISKNLLLPENSNCFPTKIYYGFIVEADCSISNIWVCPKLMFCENMTDEKTFREKLIEYMKNMLHQIKTTPAILNGQKVAIYTKGVINLDPQRE